MTTHAQLIESCIELIAEKTEDLSPAVYQRFFKRFPEAEELFGVDPVGAVKGSMIVSLLLEMMAFSQGNINPEMIEHWIHLHKSYDVTYPMYQAMFTSLKDAIEETVGPAWTPAMHDAWQAQFDVLSAFIRKVYDE